MSLEWNPAARISPAVVLSVTGLMVRARAINRNKAAKFATSNVKGWPLAPPYLTLSKFSSDSLLV